MSLKIYHLSQQLIDRIRDGNMTYEHIALEICLEVQNDFREDIIDTSILAHRYSYTVRITFSDKTFLDYLLPKYPIDKRIWGEKETLEKYEKPMRPGKQEWELT